ncbi:MAG: hypothetical protein LBL13_13960 [Bacteroidales bacterium]|jgi:3-oxoacyl-[acyl-carrier-protein] synthase-3|nr:hypothetical protein [Bacteroidales bacterium]
MDVFAFGITTVPKSIKKFMENFHIDHDCVDFFIFHQANKAMNEKIREKLKIEPEKVPHSLHEFGNTSSASIPLTIVTQIAEQIKNKETRFVACGFGVGLSWCTVFFKTNNPVISKLVEL